MSQPVQPAQQHVVVMQPLKSKGTAWLLLLFLGGLGAHRFYLGRTGSGIFYALTVGGFVVGMIIDLFRLNGMIEDTNNRIRAGANL